MLSGRPAQLWQLCGSEHRRRMMRGTNDRLATNTPGVFGLDADAYRFNLELEYDDGQWLLIGARWGQLVGELH